MVADRSWPTNYNSTSASRKQHQNNRTSRGLRGGDRVHQRSPPLPDPEPSDAARASEGFGLRSPDIGPEMTDQRDAKQCRPVSLEPP
jgi:hypothetical protein